MPRFRSAISIVCLLLWGLPVLAKPQGMRVIAGEAKKQADSATSLELETGKKTVLEWDSFSIGAKETVSFHQTDGDSTVLNRVTGGDWSSLMGSLQSNGKVYL